MAGVFIIVNTVILWYCDCHVVTGCCSREPELFFLLSAAFKDPPSSKNWPKPKLWEALTLENDKHTDIYIYIRIYHMCLLKLLNDWNHFVSLYPFQVVGVKWMDNNDCFENVCVKHQCGLWQHQVFSAHISRSSIMQEKLPAHRHMHSQIHAPTHPCMQTFVHTLLLQTMTHTDLTHCTIFSRKLPSDAGWK